MFKLKSMEIGPFRSFAEPQKIEFPENGMVLIEGKNLVTGGSSRTGKTNFLLAIEYVRGTCVLPSTQLQSWNSDEPPTVKLKSQINDLEVDLNRAKKLEIFKNGKEFQGSASQKEEEIFKLTGLSPEVMTALTYRGQRQDGLFLSKKNAEKSEFLVPLLGLDKFEEAQRVGQKNINYLGVDHGKLNSSVETLKGTVDTFKIEGNLEEFKSELFGFKNQLEDINQKLLDSKSNQENARIKNESEAKAAKEHVLTTNLFYQQQEKLNQLQTSVPVFTPDETELNKHKQLLREAIAKSEILFKENEEKRKEYDKIKSEINKNIYNSIKEQEQVPSLKARKKDYEDEIKIIKSSKCPTCLQEWIKGQDKLKEFEDKVTKLEIRLNELSDIDQNIEQLNNKLIDLGDFKSDPKIEKYNKIIEIIGKDIATETAKLDSAKAVHNSKFAKDIAEIKAIISDIQVLASNAYNQIKSKWSEIDRIYVNEIQYLNNQKSELQQKISVIQGKINNYETSKKQLDKIQSDLNNKKDELNKIQENLNTEDDLINLIGRNGFLGKIFDEILIEIAIETNETLSQVANTSDVTIEFKSETLTQSGDIKKNIVPIVTVGSHSAPIKSILSGGMLTMVELAVDLAVCKVISRRTGIVPGYLILDECWTGLDNVCKEGCFELLKIYSKDKLVLCVDHASEMKALFDKVITIVYDKNGISYIQ